jgi:hypothetical protein
MPSASLTFDLSSLGWKAFQDLCGSVLRQVLGQTVVGFSAGRDMGRDWAFQGRWLRHGAEPFDGQLVVQCKFHEGGGHLRAAEITSELPKIAMLYEKRLCDTYVLMTNLRTSSKTDADISTLVRKAGPPYCIVIGGQQIDTYLREEPRLRALVPRVYGLGDLAEILDDRAYAQAETVLSFMKEELRKFVVTAPYGRSIEALNRHGFVLLLGSAAAGKSMIASALAMAAVDQWGLPSIKVDAPELFRAHWNPHDRHQFFWVDDAFGTTQYQLKLADDWNRIIPQLKAAIAGGTRVVMTSRDYIWRAASRDLKLAEFEPLESSQVVVDVHDLSLTDKQQILYNHLKFGDQPQAFKTRVKGYLREACEVDPFLPEVARRFGSTRFTTNVGRGRYDVRSFFANPVEHLREVIQQLGPDGRAALAFIYIAGGKLTVPVSLNEERTRALAALQSTLGGVTSGLDHLRGSLVSLTRDPETAAEHWGFQHPTIGEAFRSIVEQDHQLFPLYLAGMSSYTLMGETTCGDRGVEGAVIVHEQDWPIVVRRLKEMVSGYPAQQRDTYLVQRTSCQFLAFYASEIPDHVGAGVETLPPRLASRLLECRLLSEKLRRDLSAAYTAALIQELDGTALEPAAAKLYTPSEFDHLLELVRDEMLPVIDEVLGRLSYRYDGSEPPDEWLGDTYDVLSVLRDEFAERGDAETAGLLDDALSDLGGLESELQENYTPEPDFDDDRDDFRGWSEPAVFDVFADVDA